MKARDVHSWLWHQCRQSCEKVQRHFEHNEKPSRTRAFDCGAAWANLALQGARMGLVTHGMAGLDYERAASELSVPENFAVQCMIAIGHPSDATNLPEEMRDKEQPCGHKTVVEITMEGGFST